GSSFLETMTRMQSMRFASAALLTVLLLGCTGNIGTVASGSRPGSRTRMEIPSPSAPPGAAGDPGALTDLSSGALANQCANPTVGPSRIWRLSRDQIRQSIKTALGVDVKPEQLSAFNDGTAALFRNEAASLSIHKADAGSWALSVADLAKTAIETIKSSKLCTDFAATACAPTLV